MGGMRTVLVTDADRGSAVTIIRSLGRKGLRVIASDSNPRSIGFLSRYSSERLVYPAPDVAPDRFVDALCRAVVDRGVDLLIPVTDEAIQPIAHVREHFERSCRLALPSTDALMMASDKSRTLALAESLGIPVPRTRMVRTLEEAREAAASLGWPIVLKPPFSRRYDPDRRVIEKYSVGYADTLDLLLARVRPSCGGQGLLLQEYRQGAGEGVELLAWRGRVVAAFQHRRLAEVPLTGGRSAWRESVPLDPALFGHASKLAQAMAWTGLMMVEFKVGEEVSLIEVNGRIWNSLPLAVLSGMDFPSLLADLYFGGPPAGDGPRTAYRVGVRSFHLEYTLNWIARVLLGMNEYPFLPIPPRRRIWGVLAGLLSPRQKLDLSCRDDPRPTFAEVVKVARKSGRKLMEALRSGGPDRG